jgi:hypothetical protein
MGFKPNPAKEDLIIKYGETYGLPLFDQDREIVVMKSRNSGSRYSNLPDWIWTGNSVKAEVFREMKDKFADDSLLYLRAIIELGGSATDHEVKEYFNDSDKWPLHIVSARRNYFMDKQFIKAFNEPIIKSYPYKYKTGPKGKPNTIWFVDFKQLYKIIYNIGG